MSDGEIKKKNSDEKTALLSSLESIGLRLTIELEVVWLYHKIVIHYDFLSIYFNDLKLRFLVPDLMF